MGVTRFEELAVTSSLSVGGSIALPSGSVSNSQVAAAAEIDADKLEHLYKPGTNLGLDSDATPTAQTKVVFVATGACVIRAFHCVLVDTGTTTDVDFDLLINGVSALSAVVNITNADADGLVKDGTINTSALVADDIVTIDLAVTTSTGALGPWAWFEVTESAN